jgi:hypothetical protein
MTGRNSAVSSASPPKPPLRRAGKGKRLVIANGAEAEVNESLVELIAAALEAGGGSQSAGLDNH